MVGTPGQDRARSSAGIRTSDPNSTWTVHRAASEQVISENKTQSVLSHVEALREETQQIKSEIAARKVRLLRRRSEFNSAKQELSQSQASAVEPVDKSIKRTEHRWEVMHNKTAESRLFLCREVALLYGLQQRKRKKGGLGRDVYLIGGVPIADLRDLNSMYVLDSFRSHLNHRRCNTSPRHNLYHSSRPPHSPSLTLPLPPTPSRNYPSSWRLPSPNDFLP